MVIPRIRTQKPGHPDGGPITPSLLAMSTVKQNAEPVSPVGFDLARIFRMRRLRVVFLNTGGGGVTPWRNWIGLDSSYPGMGQTRSAYRVALVAHELTHVLQRERNDPYYWPTGGLRPARGRRWLGDSTNYMEVLSYLVGNTVEYDLLTEGLDPAPIRERDRRRLILSNRLATFSGNPINATHAVLKFHPDNRVYRQNCRYELTLPDHRIPPGGWKAWLGRLGFSTSAIRHIETIAASGRVEKVSAEELERMLARA